MNLKIKCCRFFMIKLTQNKLRLTQCSFSRIYLTANVSKININYKLQSKIFGITQNKKQNKIYCLIKAVFLKNNRLKKKQQFVNRCWSPVKNKLHEEIKHWIKN